MSDPRPENEGLPSIRESLEKAFDEAEEVDDESGQSGEQEERVLHGEGREEQDGDERPGESAGAEAELVEQEEGGDEEHVLEESDDDSEEDDSEAREEVVDEEEEAEGREESEEVSDLDAGPLEAPDFWPDGVKSEFSKMPPKAQEYYMNSFKGMQADYTQKMQSIAEVKRAIDPVRDELTRTGVSEGEMIRRFVAVHKRLEDDPGAAIKWVADLYGVDVNAPAGEAKPPADPRVEQLEAKVTEHEQQAAIQRAHAANAEILALRKAGKMPLYEEAEQAMIGVVASLQQAGQPVPPVKELYEEVVWRTPALREKHLANSQVAQRQTKLEEKKKNVAKSKRAAGKRKPSSAPPASDKRQKGSTIRDELSRRYDEAMRG